MKFELILFFVVACMAQEEELDEDYDLFKDYFGDWATLRHLGGYLYRNELVGCYLKAKGDLEEIARNFKINLTTAETIPTTLAWSYQTVASFLIKTLKEISVKIISGAYELFQCQTKIWEQISDGEISKAVDVITECRKEFLNLFGSYESQSKVIKDESSKAKIKNKLDEIIEQTEKELKKVNEIFEKCIQNPPSIH